MAAQYPPAQKFLDYTTSVGAATVARGYQQQVPYASVHLSEMSPVLQQHIPMVPVPVGYENMPMPAAFPTATAQAQYTAMTHLPAPVPKSSRALPAPSCNIFIHNLNPTVSWRELKDFLRKAGPVERCEVFTDSQGRSRGYASATFRTIDGAEAAMLRFHGRKFMGSKLKVTFEREASQHAVETDRRKSKVSTKATYGADEGIDEGADEPLIVDGSVQSIQAAKMANDESSDEDGT